MPGESKRAGIAWKDVVVCVPGASALILAALYVRLSFISRVSLAGDEAVFGLMSIAIGRGEEYPLYCWGAHYASALISYIAIPVMAILGVTTFAFKAATLPWTVGLVLLAYAHCLRRDGRLPGFLSALTLAVPLPTFLCFSVAAHGGYPETYFLGLAIWIAALGAVENPSPARFALLGLLSGLSFAILWLGAPFILSALWLILRRRASTLDREPARRLTAMGCGALIGSLPFWIYNIAIAPGATFRRLGGRSLEATATTGILDAAVGRLRHLDDWGKSTQMGLEVLFRPWAAGVPALEPLMPWIVIAAIFAGARQLTRRKDDRGELVIAFLGALLLFNLAGNLTRDRQWSILLPALVIAWHGWPQRILIPAACAAVLICAAADVRYVAATSPSPVIGPAVEILKERNADAIVADYDHAYAIAFLRHGGILASGAAPPNPGDRRPDWTARIPDAVRPAYLLPDDKALRDFESRLIASDIRYERRAIANRVLLLPDRPGSASWLLYGAAYPAVPSPK